MRIVLPILLIVFYTNGYAQITNCVGEQGKLEWLIFDDIVGQVDRNPSFPNSPGGIELIRNLETEIDFSDAYSSLIRGFIKAPATGLFQFNVTGKDYVEFYLSTDENPENSSLLVETDWTNYNQHDKNESQTNNVVLTEGNFYYFELHHQELQGSEHARISWKIPLGIDEWRTVGEEFLYSYACAEYCEPKGTRCDDGNDETVDDIYDGACNCIGIPKELPSCVGERDELAILFYDNIDKNGSINDLLNDPRYPLKPTRVEFVDELRLPYQSNYNYFGSKVKAFLSVPLSGTYEFMTIGNTRSELYLSLSGDLTDVALIANSNGVTSKLELVKNELYYIKIIHTEKEWSEEFAALWRTPFSKDSTWKYMDGTYLLGYNCELACMPEGTPCDDGDAETIQDMFDENCQCSGIYCPDGNCPESKSYEPIDACAETNAHSSHIDDSWQSCTPSESMNAERGRVHWIQYDLGSVMPIGQSHVWNYNVEGETDKGFKKVAIDLSLDGLVWETLGEFDWPQASGENSYEGFVGPDFTGESARYVLISAIENWGNPSCSGLSELTFKVSTCPSVGTICNDNDSSTEHDAYNEDCLCIGESVNSSALIRQGLNLRVYPNPTNSWTSISFHLDKTSTVDLNVYNNVGQLIAEVVDGVKYSEGTYEKLFPAHILKAGQYVIELKTDNQLYTQKLLISP